MSPNAQAALFMMASMASFTINDAMVKLAGAQMPLFQIIVLRGTLATVLILLLARSFGALRFALPRRDWILMGARGVSEAGATFIFLSALLDMPLANVTAVLQILPLTVTLGAVLFFGERVGWRRAMAIALGFVGMLLIVRPGPDGCNIFTLYAIGAVVCVTLRDLVTRRISAQTPSLTATLFSAVSVLIFGLIASASGPDWVEVSLPLAALIVGSAFFIIGGYYLSTLVMRVGEISFSAPFRYTGLVWALVLGWLIFGEWPDGLTLIGASVVVASGLFAFYREQVRRTEA